MATYGFLYDWETAKIVCPSGWHLPSDVEWGALSNFIGGKDNAGGKLKEKGTSHWETPNKDATNKTGFTALPGGYRADKGTFINFGNYGTWWSSTEYYSSTAYSRSLYSNISSFYSDFNFKVSGFSVRCLKD